MDDAELTDLHGPGVCGDMNSYQAQLSRAVRINHKLRELLRRASGYYIPPRHALHEEIEAALKESEIPERSPGNANQPGT